MLGSRRIGVGLLIAFSAACAAPAPPNITPSVAVGPPRIELPSPGLPYTAADMFAVLERMPRSELADELIRHEVAEALANAVWTFDGKPYDVISADGFCGPGSCQVSVQGIPEDSIDGRMDHYIFDVNRESFELSRSYVGLGGLPAELYPQLEAIARAGLPVERLEGMQFDTVTWLPPPEFGRFEVIFDDGGLEQSRGLRVVIDGRVGSVILAEDFRR